MTKITAMTPKATVSSVFQEMVEKKYAEMRREGLSECILDEQTLGGVGLYLNDKPEFCLWSFGFENGDVVYVGSKEI